MAKQRDPKAIIDGILAGLAVTVPLVKEGLEFGKMRRGDRIANLEKAVIALAEVNQVQNERIAAMEAELKKSKA